MSSWLASITADPLADFHSLAGNRVVQQLANVLGFTKLPEHAHEVLLFTGFYFVVYFLSSLVSPAVCPQYKKLSPRIQHGFDEHVVSQVNAIVMCALSLPLFFTPELDSLTSYTPYAGLVAAHAIGYFLWDVWDTLFYFKYNGVSFFAHAATALFTFVQTMRPFLLNFAAPFMWFEASTPFVNINWFAGYVPGLVSPGARQVNGLVLLIVFFVTRIVFGPINGYRLFSEALTSGVPEVPNWAVYSVLFCYLTLTVLNFVWFSKMLKILKRTIQQRSKSQ